MEYFNSAAEICTPQIYVFFTNCIVKTHARYNGPPSVTKKTADGGRLMSFR